VNIQERAEGLGLLTSSDPIQPGDMYLAERNTGPKLLTCNKVVNTHLGDPDYIVPTEIAYCFDARECVKLIGFMPIVAGGTIVSSETMEALAAEIQSLMEEKPDETI